MSLTSRLTAPAAHGGLVRALRSAMPPPPVRPRPTTRPCRRAPRGWARRRPAFPPGPNLDAIPYWELHAKPSVAAGIEAPFLTAYKEGSLHYLLIAADRI